VKTKQTDLKTVDGSKRKECKY